MNRTPKGPRGNGITWMAVIGVPILVSILLLSGAPAVTTASVRSAMVEETAQPSANKVGVATQRILQDEAQIDGATRPQDAQPPRLSDMVQAPATYATVASATPATPATPVKAVTSPAVQATAAPPSIRLVALPSLKVDVLDARGRYYSVSGRTPAQIVASAKRNIPADPSGKDRNSMAYVGPVVWEHMPSYVMDQSSGACTITGVTSSTRYQATLPRWTSPSKVPAELLTWWRAVLRHIQEHESGHTRIFAKYVRALPSRVAGQPCSNWQAKVTAWSADLARAQANFDAAEARWVFPKYTGPKNW